MTMMTTVSTEKPTLHFPLQHVLLVTALLGMLAWAMHLPVNFGAHPWWAQSTIAIGVPIGALIGLAFWISRAQQTVRIAVSTFVFGLAIFAAKTGQIRFVNSYAEDVFAGQIWYFGWIAVAATGTMVCLAIASSRGH